MAIVRLFLEICLFRQGPQDIPHSSFLFRSVLVIYLVAGGLVAAMQTDGINPILQVAIQTVLVFVFVWGCLWLTGYLPRFLQVITAFLASDVVITLVALPFLFWVMAEPRNLTANLLLIGIIFWNILVMGHILRCALDRSFLYGFGLAFLFVYLSFKLMAAVLPQAV